MKNFLNMHKILVVNKIMFIVKLHLNQECMHGFSCAIYVAIIIIILYIHLFHSAEMKPHHGNKEINMWCG